MRRLLDLDGPHRRRTRTRRRAAHLLLILKDRFASATDGVAHFGPREVVVPDLDALLDELERAAGG